MVPASGKKKSSLPDTGPLTIPQGDSVSSDKPVSHTFWQDLEHEEGEITTELVYSDAKTPPTRCDDSVKRLCLIRWAKIPLFQKLPSWQNTEGKVLHQICYEVRMVAQGASLDFAIYHNRKRMASQSVAVDFDTSGHTKSSAVGPQ